MNDTKNQIAQLQKAMNFLNGLAKSPATHALPAEIDYDALARLAAAQNQDISADDIARAFQICMQMRSKTAMQN